MSQFFVEPAAGPPAPGTVTDLTGDAGTNPVGPDGANNINIFGDPNAPGIITRGDAATNTLFVGLDQPVSCGIGQTIDVGTADIVTIDLGAVAGTYTFEAIVAGKALTASGIGGSLFATVKTDGATATLINTVDNITNADLAIIGASFTFVVSGNDLILRVTGSLGSVIDWKGCVTFVSAPSAATPLSPSTPVDLHITPFIVSPNGSVDGASYTTIQSAINAANAAGGGVVYIQPASYTENLNLLDNVDLYGTPAVSQNQGATTTIIGQHTPPASGHVGFNSIYFQNTSHIFNSAAAGSTHIVFLNCESAVQNGYFLNLPNWTGIFEFWDNNPSAAGAPFAVNDGGINNSGGATLFAFDCGIGFGTNVMALSGVIFGTGINFSCPINFGTGSQITMDDCQFAGQVTFSGNSTGNLNTSRFTGGSAPAITMSSSSAVGIATSVVDSTNNPAITGAGAGTLALGDITFLNNQAFASTVNLASKATFVRTPIYTDQGLSTTVRLNSGSFATAAVTLTTPASTNLSDGDLLEIVATNGAVVIQLAGTQVAHNGSSVTSSGGTITGTATGDSITLRYQASTNDWWATSVIGTFVLA